MANEEILFTEKVRHPSDNYWISMRQVATERNIVIDGSVPETSENEYVSGSLDLDELIVNINYIEANWNINIKEPGSIYLEPDGQSNGLIIKTVERTIDNINLQYLLDDYEPIDYSISYSQWDQNDVQYRSVRNETVAGDIVLLPEAGGSTAKLGKIISVDSATPSWTFELISTSDWTIDINSNSTVYFCDSEGTIFNEENIKVNIDDEIITDIDGEQVSSFNPSLLVYYKHHQSNSEDYWETCLYYIDAEGVLNQITYLSNQKYFIYSFLNVNTTITSEMITNLTIPAPNTYFNTIIPDFYDATLPVASITYKDILTLQSFYYENEGNIIRYYDGNEQFLTVGNYNKPIYIDEGQFKVANITADMTNDIVPKIGYNYDIGSTAAPWNNIYANSLNLKTQNENQNEYVSLTSDLMGNLLVNGDIQDTKNNISLLNISSKINSLQYKNKVFAAPVDQDGIPNFRYLDGADIITGTVTRPVKVSGGTVQGQYMGLLGNTTTLTDQQMGRFSYDSGYLYYTALNENSNYARQWRIHGSNDVTAPTVQYRNRTADNSGWDSFISPFWNTQTEHKRNQVLAAPSGADGKATFRTLIAADIPSLPASKINSGTIDAARLSIPFCHAVPTTHSIKLTTTWKKIALKFMENANNPFSQYFVINNGCIQFKQTGFYLISARIPVYRAVNGTIWAFYAKMHLQSTYNSYNDNTAEASDCFDQIRVFSDHTAESVIHLGPVIWEVSNLSSSRYLILAAKVSDGTGTGYIDYASGNHKGLSMINVIRLGSL